jgi:hypothetical protein
MRIERSSVLRKGLLQTQYYDSISMYANNMYYRMANQNISRPPG